MAIWPWQINGELIEANEWLTDVIRAKSSEQRFAQRQIPRQSFVFSHNFTEQGYNAARSIIRQNSSLQVPDWTLAVDVGSVAVDSAPLVTYSEPGVYIGDQVLVWESPTKHEAAAVVDTDSGSGLYLDGISDDYDNAKIIPLRSAQAPEGLQGSRRAGPRIETSIEFNLTDARDIGQSAYPKYRGHDLVTDCPVIAGETFSEPLQWPLDSIDNGVNYPTHFATRNTWDASFMMRWHVFNRADLYSLRRFIHSRRGKWKSFWLPSFRNDFTLAQQIGASDGFVVVYAPDGITDLGYATFDIEIDGQYYRQVTGYSASTAADGRAILQLNIDSAIGTTLGAGSRISYLRHLRFAADRIEFNHQFNRASRISTHCAVPCIEIPA